MDCSKTKNFINEFKRMCEFYNPEDNGCSNENGECPVADIEGYNDACYGCETDKLVSLVQKWSDEHPRKTYLQDFKEKFKSQKYSDDEIIHNFCVENLYDKNPIKCNGSKCYCTKCWHQILESEVE